MCIEWSRGRIASQFMGSHRILCDPTWILDNSTCCKFNSSTMVLGLSMEMHKLLSMAYKNMISNAKSLIKQKEEGHKNKDHVVLMKDYWSKVELQLSVGSIRILRCWTKLLPCLWQVILSWRCIVWKWREVLVLLIRLFEEISRMIKVRI